MSGKKITTKFFNRPTLGVAKELLGKYLIRKIGSRIISGKIIETEAYCGPYDLASHASKGRTKRTEVMFGQPGLIYVYMIYGMYYCLNIITEKENFPAAVLIRAVDLKNCNGPGKICREFKIDKKFNGLNISDNGKLWIENRGERINNKNISATPRIGIDYAGEYRDKPWRFILAHHTSES